MQPVDVDDKTEPSWFVTQQLVWGWGVTHCCHVCTPRGGSGSDGCVGVHPLLLTLWCALDRKGFDAWSRFVAELKEYTGADALKDSVCLPNMLLPCVEECITGRPGSWPPWSTSTAAMLAAGDH